nr:hypothetical protein BaRGS_000093 [Batillaria attramentaria]
MGGMSAEDQDKGWQDWTVGGEAGLYSIVNNLLVMVNIINISLATGIVPTSFKKAVVQPIIKKAGTHQHTIGKYIELTLDRLNAKSELLESKGPASYPTVLELA